MRFLVTLYTAVLLYLICAALFSPAVLAGDWPQILGPGRDGVALSESIVDSFPGDGPRVAWRTKVGSGYAGVAVAGGKAVLFHRVGDQEIVAAFDAGAGTPLWKVAFPTKFVSGYSSDHGPRCVPVIAQGRVFAFGAEGKLHCVSLKDGQKLWSRDAYGDYGASEGFFGAGSTPLVVGEKALVNVGGDRADAGLVAFSATSGKTLWHATKEQASYSSPVLATIGDVKQAIFVTRYHALGVNPDNGNVYWSIPFGKRGPTVNAANPVVLDDHVFLSASYGVGALYAKVSGDSPQVVWANDNVMSSQYTTSVFRDGYLYGIDGRHDIPPAHLRCFDPKNGKIAWSKLDFGAGAVILADGKLILQTTTGELVLAEASPERLSRIEPRQSRAAELLRAARCWPTAGFMSADPTNCNASTCGSKAGVLVRTGSRN